MNDLEQDMAVNWLLACGVATFIAAQPEVLKGSPVGILPCQYRDISPISVSKLAIAFPVQLALQSLEGLGL